MAESSSASERSRSPSPARAVTGVKLSRTFVWLRERPKAIPRGKPWDQLNRDGRVKDIEFSKKFTERQMRNLVRQNFSELKEADFTRIRLYKSGSRGSVLSKVAKNIPDASTLLHRFSGGSSKRVYILLKSDNKDGGDPTSRADPSATVPTSPNTLAPVPANAGVPPTLPLPSRTNEVRRCEERLLASCRGENTSLPSFLVHSFDELCWQARELTMAICVVLLNPRRENTGVREGIVRALRWLSAESQGKGMLYWPGETSSADGRTVCNISGVRYTSDAILVIVPSSSSVWKPTLVDCFEDSSITATNIEDRLATALEKAKDMLKVLAIQRERLETFRRDRAEQEEDLLKAQEQDSNEKNEGEEKEKDKVEEKQKEEDNDIRGKRKSRVLEEVTEGPKTVKIVLRHCNGKMERCFKKGAFFQEVYDWAGADATLPLHFSIQRGRQVIRHRDTLKTPEVLDVYGRDEREIITLLGTKVSFRGNVPSDELSESELSTTVIDATQEEQREEEEEEEEEEKKKRRRRKSKEEKRGRKRRGGKRKEKKKRRKNRKERKRRRKNKKRRKRRRKNRRERKRRDTRKRMKTQRKHSIQETSRRIKMRRGRKRESFKEKGKKTKGLMLKEKGLKKISNVNNI